MELAIWEEMLCSAYAGINEYSVRVSVYQAQAVEVLDKAEESAKGPEWISLPKPESVTAKKQNADEPEGLSPPETQKKFLAAGYNDSDDESFILDNDDDDIITPTLSQIKEYNKRLIFETSGFVYAGEGIRLSKSEKTSIASELKSGNGHLIYGQDVGYCFAGTGYIFILNRNGDVTVIDYYSNETLAKIKEVEEYAGYSERNNGESDRLNARSRATLGRNKNGSNRKLQRAEADEVTDIPNREEEDSKRNKSRGSENSKRQIKLSAADTEGEYLSLAEKYRDGTATEAETEQLLQMVDVAANMTGGGVDRKNARDTAKRAYKTMPSALHSSRKMIIYRTEILHRTS